jgi:hypothetical protein
MNGSWLAASGAQITLNGRCCLNGGTALASPVPGQPLPEAFVAETASRWLETVQPFATSFGQCNLNTTPSQQPLQAVR